MRGRPNPDLETETLFPSGHCESRIKAGQGACLHAEVTVFIQMMLWRYGTQAWQSH